MTNGKLLICLWAVFTSVFALAHDAKGPPSVVKILCTAQLENRLTERGSDYFYGIGDKYFGALGPKRAHDLGAIVASNPLVHLGIMLDLVRGEKDGSGRWIKSPLTLGELDNFLDNVVPDMGLDIIPHIYDHKWVQRDPVLFYLMSIQFAAHMRALNEGKRNTGPILKGRTIN